MPARQHARTPARQHARGSVPGSAEDPFGDGALGVSGVSGCWGGGVYLEDVWLGWLLWDCVDACQVVVS